MGKHAIIVIKNKENEYLQYFDDKWNSYLFLNCKMENKDDVKSIINEVRKCFAVSDESIKCSFVGEKTHKKFSEKDKMEKEYTHYFYIVDLLEPIEKFSKDEFESLDRQYKWFAYDELLQDERIQKVNNDIVKYIKEFNI